MSDDSNNYYKVQMPVLWNQELRPVEPLEKTIDKLKNISRKTIAKRLLLKSGSCKNCCHMHTEFAVSGLYYFCDERNLKQEAFPKEMYCNKWEGKEENIPR